jgi:hypothetical protein
VLSRKRVRVKCDNEVYHVDALDLFMLHHTRDGEDFLRGKWSVSYNLRIADEALTLK